MPNRRRGDENIMFDGMATGYHLSDFWEWSSSDLLNNTLRGAFCEFIVAAALDLDLSSSRTDWTPWDLTAPHQWRDGDILKDEVHIEVKSSSYLQAWEQSKLSNIVFSIRPTLAWDAISGYGNEVQRQSDVYIFCLYAVTDRAQADPLILDGWQFYVIPTRTLDSICGGQKTISLRSLERLGPILTDYAGIRNAIFQCLEIVPPPQHIA